MSERDVIGEKARTFFEDLWRQGDPWELESSEFEQARYARQLAMLEGSRYASVLEIGCGAGVFTRSLAEMADHVVALDIAEGAIAQALARFRPTTSTSASSTSWSSTRSPRGRGTWW